MSEQATAEQVIQNAGVNGYPGAAPMGIGGGLSIDQALFGTGLDGRHTQPIVKTAGIEVNLRYNLLSNYRQILSQCYAEMGLFQVIVDVPVEDALRGGLEIRSDQLDEDQRKQLHRRLVRDGDMKTAAMGAKWARLFGGGAVIIMVSDQDPAKPLNMDAIGEDTEVYFRAADQWELSTDESGAVPIDGDYDAEVDPEDGRLDIKEVDRLANFEHARQYTYYGVKIHPSRVIRIMGKDAPSFIRGRLRGWGMSHCEVIVRSINQYLKTTNLTYEVLDEWKLDVYKFKNLVNTLATPGGRERVMQRVQMANMSKNYNNAIAMDAEDDFDHKQLSFSGIAEVMDQIKKQVASDLRMPLTKIFGISAQGFNSGQDDIEVYNGMVESSVRTPLEPVLHQIVEIKCAQMFGFVPDDLEINYKPLRVLSAVDEETVKTQKYARLFQARQAGEITVKEFREACNQGNLLDVKLNTDDADIAEIEEQQEDAAAGEAGDGDQTEDQGDDNVVSMDGKRSASKSATPDTPKTKTAEVAKNNLGADIPISTTTARSKKRKKAHQKFYIVPRRYSGTERVQRSLQNSAAYDRAAYEADGGDGWIDPRRKDFFEDPADVDQYLWKKACRASLDALGEERWEFIVWWYKKMGGKFSYVS